jgi:hypothetical protein
LRRRPGQASGENTRCRWRDETGDHGPEIPLDASPGRGSGPRYAPIRSRRGPVPDRVVPRRDAVGSAGHGRVDALRQARGGSRHRFGADIIQPFRAGPDPDRVRARSGHEEAEVHNRIPLRADAASELRAADQHALRSDSRAGCGQHRRRQRETRAARLRRFPRSRRPIRAGRGISRRLSRVLALTRRGRFRRQALSRGARTAHHALPRSGTKLARNLCLGTLGQRRTCGADARLLSAARGGHPRQAAER